MPRFLRPRALPFAAAATFLAVSTPVALAVAGGSPTAAATGVTHVRYGPVDFALSNWGGYIANGTTDEFTRAVAHWKIAAATCKSSSDLYAPWVGIDGDGDTSVEQTGVQTDCSSGSPVSSAWYEMYPAAPVYFSNAVSTGDSISASVTYANGEFTIKISDTTKKWSHTVHKELSSAKRLSAEAIIEAPGGGGTFPTFTSVNFTGVKFNKQDLSTFNPTASDTGTSSDELVPSAITNGDDFSMAPKA